MKFLICFLCASIFYGYPYDLLANDKKVVLDNTAKQFKRAHNKTRRAKGIQGLQWDENLAKVAAKWAKNLASRCTMEHSKGSGYGENLAMSWGSRPRTVAEVVSWWTLEEQWYDYKTNSCKDGEICGHYTQVVWRNSKKLGCAIAYCEDRASLSKGTIYVCNYSPPGNYRGQRPY